MREKYPRSDETFKVLSGHLQEFADEAEKDYSHFNRIKNGEYQDPFSPFRALFRWGCRTTAPVEIWLNDLQGIYHRARGKRTATPDLSEMALEKLDADGEALHEILAAMRDKKLTKAECHSILAKLEKNRELNDAIERAVLANLGEISEQEERKLKAV